jgi:UDP-3-O-[3-hydroxymyristoyl] glucosamine N-acyltransferase
MLDPRFYEGIGPVSAAVLAAGAPVIGPSEKRVSGLEKLDSATPDDLTFFDGHGAPPPTQAGVVFVPDGASPGAWGDCTLILTPHPRAAFARAVHLIARERSFSTNAGERIDPSAILEPDVRIGAGVVIGAGVRIGAGTHIAPNTVIGPGVTIGRGCNIGANAVIGYALIGDRVKISAGAVIGQSGFGVTFDASGPVDVPHFGRVIIQDDATIGAGTTIDRGLFDDTVIAEKVKIDNLSHIAHNCVIGRGVVIAAYGGISGSTRIEEGAMLGGRVGIADHVTIGVRAVLAAGSLVMHDVPAGEKWGGYLAKPIRQWMREQAWLKRAIGKPHGTED